MPPEEIEEPPMTVSSPAATARAAGSESVAAPGGAKEPSESLWQRAQHGWPKSFPLVQFPNAPLLIGLGALLVAAMTQGGIHDYARATFYAALAVWAWGELTAGVNWVRRVVGAVGLVYVVMTVAEAL